MWSLEAIVAMNKQWQDEFDLVHPEVAQAQKSARQERLF